MNVLPDRPLTVLIAALGGEGGGVLANWLVDAAAAERFPVQSTSIPGVAQRTGATTYYIEIFPARIETLGERRPVLALTPSPGNIDLMVASELIEAGRAMQNGFVSPQRTTLVASTHRIYAIAEKMQMGDGRYDESKIRPAAEVITKRAILFDMARLAEATGSVINAVLFGAMAGSGVLPLERRACEAAIGRSGVGVEASMRGFAAGFSHAVGETQQAPEASGIRPWGEQPVERVRRIFPSETHRILEEGVARLMDYQDRAYADLYLDRLAPMLMLDRAAEGYKLTNETGRHLALWMSYEDVIRVADLKTRASRLRRVREEVGARPDQPVAIVEYLKPGLEEFTAMLPPGLARRIGSFAARRRLENRLNVGLYVKTTSVTGYLVMRTLAALKTWRRRTSRFIEEQSRIGAWLGEIRRVAAIDRLAAGEITECARLIKGYGDTHRRGWANFTIILSTLAAGRTPSAAAIAKARAAALADPDGQSLARALAEIAAAPPGIPSTAVLHDHAAAPRAAHAGE